MIDPGNVPQIELDEYLARFILQGSHLRADRSIKPNAFMPPPNLELSVTRHLQMTDNELWMVGEDVASVRNLTLLGRGDTQASICVNQNLSLRRDPIAGNPNHAVVYNWPNDKPNQKIIAQEIAATAAFVPRQ